MPSLSSPVFKKTGPWSPMPYPWVPTVKGRNPATRSAPPIRLSSRCKVLRQRAFLDLFHARRVHMPYRPLEQYPPPIGRLYGSPGAGVGNRPGEEGIDTDKLHENSIYPESFRALRSEKRPPPSRETASDRRDAENAYSPQASCRYLRRRLRVTSTGQVAPSSTRVTTLPMITFSRTERPREPMTMRSQSSSSWTFRMT